MTTNKNYQKIQAIIGDKIKLSKLDEVVELNLQNNIYEQVITKFGDDENLPWDEIIKFIDSLIPEKFKKRKIWNILGLLLQFWQLIKTKVK